jgi:class 3 adenylate cyclase
LHIGEVTEVATSLAGEDVHKAARICSHAGGGEILASTDLAGLVEAPNGAGDPHPIELKGFAEEAEVVSLKWM